MYLLRLYLVIGQRKTVESCFLPNFTPYKVINTNHQAAKSIIF